DRRRPGDRDRPDRRPRPAPDEPRLQGPRRAADRPDRSGDRERDPRRDGRRRPLAADHARRDASRARRSEAQAAGTRDGHRLTLDVFLESAGGFDRDAAEEALARNGVSADSTVTTADGGDASTSLDDDGCVFVVKALTR